MTQDKDNFHGNENMTDEELVEVHSKLNVEKHPPTQGFLSAPLIFVFVFGCYGVSVKLCLVLLD